MTEEERAQRLALMLSIDPRLLPADLAPQDMMMLRPQIGGLQLRPNGLLWELYKTPDAALNAYLKLGLSNGGVNLKNMGIQYKKVF